MPRYTISSSVCPTGHIRYCLALHILYVNNVIFQNEIQGLPLILVLPIEIVCVLVGYSPLNSEGRINLDSDLVCFIFNYWNKNSINKAKGENPDETAHKELSHLDFHCLLIYACLNLPAVRSYLTLP